MRPHEILIADDDVALVKALTVRLEQEGYTVVAATDGYQALAGTVASTPDLLILDIHMPAGSGFSVQERKDKLDGRLAGVPVIYISGDKSIAAEKMAARHGAVALLHKPFEFEELLQEIEIALSGQTV